MSTTAQSGAPAVDLHVPAKPDEVRAWFARRATQARLWPAWFPLSQVPSEQVIAPGDHVRFGAGKREVRVRCASLEPRNTMDITARGQTYTVHREIAEADDGGTNIRTTVEGALRGKAHDRRLTHDQSRLRHDLSYLAGVRAAAPQRIVVSGSTGLVGTALQASLRAAGHRVDGISRSAPAPDSTDIHWNPDQGSLSAEALSGADAVVHLAGFNVAAGRWTDAIKRKIRDSRVVGTRLLVERLLQAPNPPKTLICASASGYYGTTNWSPVDERDPAGDGFLADVCREWEACAEPAVEAGLRVVWLRIGVVLSPRGGALEKMLPPFLAGVGGVVGSGRQPMSWVTLEDVVGITHHALFTPSVSGALNVTAPHPLPNREFTRTLGQVLRRPTIFPLPGLVVRMLFGEMGDQLLLSGNHVLPQRTRETGYRFLFEHLEDGLRFELGR